MHKTAVGVRTPDGVADAYFARPDGDGPFPGVLFYMDALGLRPRLFEMVERIAGHGYAVLAPNLFYRSGSGRMADPAGLGDPERRDGIIGRLVELIKALDTAAITRDTLAYLDFLDARDGMALGPDAIVGYCMGGNNAFKAITAFPDRIAALAGFHGGGLATGEPDSPHLGVGRITGEVYFAHADQDHGMPREQIDRLEEALAAAGVRFRSEVYRGAPHGFTMTDTVSYHAEAEQRHWRNLLGLLDSTVGSHR
ncbi:dienelactone hydrolase family protein [Umezawaea tangerina]|uniref:Carboxymethylenebutenolidase n=1 Tax=Umezawaea tangerina TaxID=84725 RepID=A0A2T0T1S4_9PSEU|nr:dienelactone hydrolase family protein [Umezawaea tangerina]PRY39612.1 carboxymethylenebutenolidase [Umezawaea tangerina]